MPRRHRERRIASRSAHWHARPRPLAVSSRTTSRRCRQDDARARRRIGRRRLVVRFRRRVVVVAAGAGLPDGEADERSTGQSHPHSGLPADREHAHEERRNGAPADCRRHAQVSRNQAIRRPRACDDQTSAIRGQHDPQNSYDCHNGEPLAGVRRASGESANWGTGNYFLTLSQVSALVTFIPVAAALTLTPGVATALVIRSTLSGGRRAAFATTLGNSAGVLAWALAAAVGIAAVVAASVTAFTIVKVTGAVVLLVMGLHALVARNEPLLAAPAPPQRSAFRDGLVTSVANPKLAVFFVALFPQFVPAHHAALPLAVGMAMIIVALDLVWYSALAWLVGRARIAFTRGPWLRRTQRLTGCVLIA